MTKGVKIKRVKKATLAERREQARENSRRWLDHELALEYVKVLFYDDEAFHNWYNELYDELRWQDYELYREHIFEKLKELEANDGKIT